MKYAFLLLENYCFGVFVALDIHFNYGSRFML